jgi:hypothetical protein
MDTHESSSRPDAHQQDAPPPSAARTPQVSFLTLLGCVILCGGGIMLLMPSAGSRESPLRMKSSNNLKEIGLALHEYHDAFGSFPPAYSVDDQGNRTHSWRALILPFLDPGLAAKYRLDEPWNSPHNLLLARYMPRVYRSPRQSKTALNDTGYVAIVGPHTLWPAPACSDIEHVPDGLTSTVMVAEYIDSGICWLKPVDLEVARMRFPPGGDGPWGRGPEPVAPVALFGDGSVQTLGRMPEDRMRGMMTTGGGEKVFEDY